MTTLKMLESFVKLMSLLSALKETSDFKEAVALMDVWKFASTMSGEQCVVTSGSKVMLLKLLVNN